MIHRTHEDDICEERKIFASYDENQQVQLGLQQRSSVLSILFFPRRWAQKRQKKIVYKEEMRRMKFYFVEWNGERKRKERKIKYKLVLHVISLTLLLWTNKKV